MPVHPVVARRRLCCGFDSYLHLVKRAEIAEVTQFADIRPIEELVVQGRRYLPDSPGGPEEWILRRGWNQESTAGKRHPMRHDLDAFCADSLMLYKCSCGTVRWEAMDGWVKKCLPK